MKSFLAVWTQLTGHPHEHRWAATIGRCDWLVPNFMDTLWWYSDHSSSLDSMMNLGMYQWTASDCPGVPQRSWSKSRISCACLELGRFHRGTANWWRCRWCHSRDLCHSREPSLCSNNSNPKIRAIAKCYYFSSQPASSRSRRPCPHRPGHYKHSSQLHRPPDKWSSTCLKQPA